MSGSGKTYHTQNTLIKPSDRVIIFDPLGDYTGIKIGSTVVRTYRSFETFVQAVFAARKTKQSFKIAWHPNKRRKEKWKDLDEFCRLIWAIGDGSYSHPIKVICEELASNSMNTQKTSPYHEELLGMGRKFNIHTINCFQRGQSVSKTMIDNCHTCVIMMQKTTKSARYLEDLTGIPWKTIDDIEEYQHILQVGKKWTASKKPR